MKKKIQVATTTANCTNLFCDLGGLPMAAMLTLAIFFGWNVTSPRRSLSQISAEVLKTEILWEIGRKKTTQNPIGYGAFRLFHIYTPRKTNMSPENQWLEDVFPIEIVPF